MSRPKTISVLLLPLAAVGLVCVTWIAQAQVARQSAEAPFGNSAVVQLVAVGPGTHGNAQECSGTGFFVNAEGYILTNAHVVEEARRCLAGAPQARILAKFPGQDARTATAVSCYVLGVDDTHDLALLKTERPPADLNVATRGPSETPYGIGVAALDPDNVPVGTTVQVTGHSSASWQAVTSKGRVVARQKVNLGANATGPSEVLAIDIALERGASGSPVRRASGGVVGIIVQREAVFPARTLAVSVRYAIQMLDKWHITWQRIPAP